MRAERSRSRATIAVAALAAFGMVFCAVGESRAAMGRRSVLGSPVRVSLDVRQIRLADAIAFGADVLENPYVFYTTTGERYHRGGCMYLMKSCIPIRLKLAKAEGLTPCKRCKPPP
jgi:hypothetical protein